MGKEAGTPSPARGRRLDHGAPVSVGAVVLQCRGAWGWGVSSRHPPPQLPLPTHRAAVLLGGGSGGGRSPREARHTGSGPKGAQLGFPALIPSDRGFCLQMLAGSREDVPGRERVPTFCLCPRGLGRAGLYTRPLTDRKVPHQFLSTARRVLPDTRIVCEHRFSLPRLLRVGREVRTKHCLCLRGRVFSSPRPALGYSPGLAIALGTFWKAVKTGPGRPGLSGRWSQGGPCVLRSVRTREPWRHLRACARASARVQTLNIRSRGLWLVSRMYLYSLPFIQVVSARHAGHAVSGPPTAPCRAGRAPGVAPWGPGWRAGGGAERQLGRAPASPAGVSSAAGPRDEREGFFTKMLVSVLHGLTQLQS